MEETTAYATPIYLEKVQCKLPSLQLLIHLGSIEQHAKGMASPFSRNWQSLRRGGGNTLNSMKMPTLRHRTSRPRRVMHADAIRLLRITPQPHVDAAESVDVRQCVRAGGLGQDNKCLVGEEPVASCLTHGFPPIRQLTLKSACTGASHLNESFSRRKHLACKRLPRHHQHVRDSVSVHSYFTRDSHTVVIRRAAHLGCLTQIGPRKRNSKSVFRSCYSPTSRQVSTRLRKFDFRDIDKDLAHWFSLGSSIPIIIPSDGGHISFTANPREGLSISATIVQRPSVCVNGQLRLLTGEVRVNAGRMTHERGEQNEEDKRGA